MNLHVKCLLVFVWKLVGRNKFRNLLRTNWRVLGLHRSTQPTKTTLFTKKAAHLWLLFLDRGAKLF